MLPLRYPTSPAILQTGRAEEVQKSPFQNEANRLEDDKMSTEHILGHIGWL